MKRPWQIWLLFLLCMAFVLPAMGWLTLKAIELDKSEARSRRQLVEAKEQAQRARFDEEQSRKRAELEEDISRALWRMDTLVSPLIINESARPHYAYDPELQLAQFTTFVPDTGKSVKGSVKGPTKGKVPIKPGGGKEVNDEPTFVPGNSLSYNSLSTLVVNPSRYVNLNWQLDASNGIVSPQYPETRTQKEIFLANGATEETIGRYGTNKRTLAREMAFENLWNRLPDQNRPSNDMLAMNRANTDDLNVDNVANLAQTGAQQEQQIFMNQPVINSGLGNNDWQLGTFPPQQSDPPVAANNSGGNIQKKQTPRQSDDQAPQTASGNRPNPAPQTENQQATQTAEQPPLQPMENNDRYSQSRQELAYQNRGNMSYGQRNRVIQRQARNTYNYFQGQSVMAASGPTGSEKVLEGISSPVWVGSQLLLARRVTRDDQRLIQGCWLDWPRLRTDLLAQISDLLPDAQLKPVLESDQVDPSRALASLPVQLVVPSPVAQYVPQNGTDTSVGQFSPIRVSLWIAWGCLGAATLAVAVLLSGVVALSERRASFVAAVTHELRTPLTTFRMYAEMLSEGMITEEPRRQKYLETLRVEADRLTHLVSNVLTYARLERGRPGRSKEDVSLDDLFQRTLKRLEDRAQQAKMDLVVEISDEDLARKVHTDPAAVEQVLFNLVDNASKYAVAAEDRRIHLEVEQTGDAMRLRVRDHGPGIAGDVTGKMFEPFSKSVDKAAQTAPGVGLGLALCRRMVRSLGGVLVYEKERQDGASLSFTLPTAKTQAGS